jgi:hypothetical protein
VTALHPDHGPQVTMKSCRLRAGLGYPGPVSGHRAGSLLVCELRLPDPLVLRQHRECQLSKDAVNERHPDSVGKEGWPTRHNNATRLLSVRAGSAPVHLNKRGALVNAHCTGAFRLLL